MRFTSIALFAASSSLLIGCSDIQDPTEPSDAQAPVTYAAFAPANTAPLAWISTPAHQSTFTQSSTISFTGSGRDPEDGTLGGASLVWSTSIDGQIGAGNALTRNNLSPGEHVLTLTGTDSQGSVFRHNRIIYVTASANKAPSASITAPVQGAAFVQGTSITFAGTASDPEDGALSGASLSWRSDRDGELGSGTSLTRNTLSVGAHVISLTATDSRGTTFRHNRTISVTVAAAPTNQAPSASITAPASGAVASQGTSLTFSGSATDPESGALTGSALVWSSSVDGQIGSGASFARSTLTAGTHTITLTARDPQGATATATRSITVAAAANQLPSSRISAPSHLSNHQQGSSVAFSGSGTDPEDGALTGASLVWRSDRDGVIGTGASVAKSNLSVGEHLISLTATDTRGGAYNHYRVITVAAAATAPQPAVVASVSVTLAASSVLVGATTTATAVARSSSGAVITGRAVSWQTNRSAVAVVTNGGIATAISAGSVNIIATINGVAGFASLTVSALAAPPPPPPPAPSPPSSSGGAEPTGMSVISDRAFNCLAPTQCETDWNYVGGGFGITQDALAPRSSSNVGEIKFPAGFTGGYSSATVYRSTNNVKTLYTSVWLKFSPNFQNHSTGINKVIHLYISGLNRIFFQASGPDLAPAFGLQQLAAPYNNGAGTTGTAAILRPNRGVAASMTRGQWHRVEILTVANTPGVANGAVSLWLNGTLVLHNTGIMFAAAGTNAAWEQFTWSPTWGGTGDSVKSEMSIRMDHVYLSGKN